MDYSASWSDKDEANFLTDLDIREILILKEQQRKAHRDKKRQNRRIDVIHSNLCQFTAGTEVPQKKHFQ